MTLEETNGMIQEFMMKFMELNQDVIQMLTEATVPNRGSLEKKIICQPCPTKTEKSLLDIWIEEVKMQDSIYPGEEQVNSKYLNFKDSAVRQGAQHI